jgi:hypothetical protein
VARNTDAPDALDMRGALRDFIVERISGVRVGVVQSYSQTDRVAVVQPVRRRRIFGTPQPMPMVRAAVGWWRFGGFLLAAEVQAGDEVLLLTCEREIWPWYVGGQPLHDPTSERMHDASDSIALPWISNAKRPFTARQPQTFWLGREDGTAGVTFTMGPLPGTTTIEGTGPGSIRLGSTAVSPALMGTETNAALNTYAGAIATAAGTLSAAALTWAGVFPATMVSNTALSTAFGAWSTSVAGAQTALSAALSAALATKTLVE